MIGIEDCVIEYVINIENKQIKRNIQSDIDTFSKVDINCNKIDNDMKNLLKENIIFIMNQK